MHTKSLTMGLVFVTCLVVAIIFFSYSSVDAFGRENMQNTTSSRLSVGRPAIKPNVSNGAIRFTVQDVRTYLEQHPFPSGPTATGKAATIRAIDFIASKEASVRLHGESIGLSDTAIVCYVELYGPFTTTYVSIPQGAKLLPTADIGVEVFDAQTGNLLLWWIPN